jgi:uncharacterized lipoprotein YehR (DUF1307 family)
MRTRRTTIAIATALLLALTACGKSEEQKQAECVKAIDSKSTPTNRPDACKDLSADDYKLLLMDHALKQAGLGNVDEHPEDLLDYGDDGLVNDSQ